MNGLSIAWQGDIAADRVVRFLIIFATQQPPGRQEECTALVEGIMTFLLGLVNALDKTIRFRVCQLLAGIFNDLPADAEVSGELADNLQEAMLERMKDKMPQIRAQAVRALCRLADPGDVRVTSNHSDNSFAGDPVTDAYLHTLATDKNK
eukprot:scaffold603667_cov52-Prasinocladus_malaysianus.AAC.1